jgi:hypothetical protein
MTQIFAKTPLVVRIPVVIQPCGGDDGEPWAAVDDEGDGGDAEDEDSGETRGVRACIGSEDGHGVVEGETTDASTTNQSMGHCTRI